VSRARSDQRAALRIEELAAGQVPRSLFGDLAGAAGHHVLVTLAAALRVVGRTEPVGDDLHFLERLAIGVEHLLSGQAVRHVVERRGRLGRGLRGAGPGWRRLSVGRCGGREPMAPLLVAAIRGLARRGDGALNR
jgi:hypothetical protein